MKLIIDLPNEFEEHFDFDKFQDSFMRICGDIRTEGCLCGNYEYELADELKKAFDKAEKFKGEEVMKIEKTPVSIRLSGPETGRINGIKLLYPFPDEMDLVSDAAKEAARKKIHVGLPKKEDFEKELFPSTPSPGLKAASEFEKNVFEYALQNRTLRVYVITFQKIVSDESSCRWDLNYMFQKDKEVALGAAKLIKEQEKTEATITEHDFTKLVTMSEAEFESLPSDKNYNLVKMYRETMRNILIPEEQND